MAKYSRLVVGSVLRSKNAGDPPYIKFSESVTLTKGATLKLESKKFQLESLQGAVEAGKVSEDVAEKIQQRIEKIPDFVLFNIVQLTQNN